MESVQVQRAVDALGKSIETSRAAMKQFPEDVRVKQWAGELTIARSVLMAAGGGGGLKLVGYEFGRENVVLRFAHPRRATEVRKGDFVHGGVLVRTSRPQHGGEPDGRIRIDTLLYRVVCSNGAIMDEGFSRRVGRRYDALEARRDALGVRETEENFEDNATRASRLFLEAAEVVDYEASFQRFREAAEQKLVLAPSVVVENVAKRLRLSEEETKLVDQELMRENDMTRYGVINAVTKVAQGLPSMRRLDFEGFGGKLADLSRHDWNALAQPHAYEEPSRPMGVGGPFVDAAVKVGRRRHH